MSDPAKNNDIEDVLSSIRRLVAENAKAAGDRDALVLTQDHRVGKPLIAKADPVVEALAAAPQGQPSALRAEPVLTRRAEGISPAAPSPAMPLVASVPKAPEPLQTPTVEAVTKPAPTNPALDAAPAPHKELMTNDRVADVPAPSFRRVAAKSQSAPVKPVEVAATPQTTAFIPPAPPLTAQPNAPELEEAMVEMAETTVLEEAITQLESSVSEADSDWEPDDVFMSENDPAPVQTPGSGSVDPAMLRDLVVETVREELRGDLGERITRNVRKLVRREIQRALTVQSLD